ncbi:kinase-like protein [Gloeophyllum trabeum ATCC 11539]|uniref:Kinase-like protein n=1 Tax=Gloeophyllum trabeum (strain ATCC 11539 / FP-39264 / Madison 617) TaxID=670483 RepID=S7Q872_GLOTA|nr:kinase-like protein [Gloeophyllum trabeum ATCC 11539]EPQ55727.1 kinase-like protein [Gloeophyllum trabeum ATCC 11539]
MKSRLPYRPSPLNHFLTLADTLISINTASSSSHVPSTLDHNSASALPSESPSHPNPSSAALTPSRGPPRVRPASHHWVPDLTARRKEKQSWSIVVEDVDDVDLYRSGNDTSRSSFCERSTLFASPIPPSTPATSVYSLDPGNTSGRCDTRASVLPAGPGLSLKEMKERTQVMKEQCNALRDRWEKSQETWAKYASPHYSPDIGHEDQGSLSDDREQECSAKVGEASLSSDAVHDVLPSLPLHTGAAEGVDVGAPAVARGSEGDLTHGIVEGTESAGSAASHVQADTDNEIETLLLSLLNEVKERKRHAQQASGTPRTVLLDDSASSDLAMSNANPDDVDHIEELLQICPSPEEVIQLLPLNKVLNLTHQIYDRGDHPANSGGYGDIYHALWDVGGRTHKVAIKVLRPRGDDVEMQRKIEKRLKRELSVWRRLKHKHIVPLYGIVFGCGPFMAMVCPWKENGSLTGYVQSHRERLKLCDLLWLLCQIASGLHYLHGLDPVVVHGDLTGSNILIDEHGVAFLCDFGLSKMITEASGSSSSLIAGSMRWAAPEIYVPNPQGAPPLIGTECDIYSFGSVMLQTLSRDIPYHYWTGLQTIKILWALRDGVKPLRPTDKDSYVSDEYWDFIHCCWASNPAGRPSASQVLDRLQAFLQAELDEFVQ